MHIVVLLASAACGCGPTSSKAPSSCLDVYLQQYLQQMVDPMHERTGVPVEMFRCLSMQVGGCNLCSLQ